jgi:hypothetical protein
MRFTWKRKFSFSWSFRLILVYNFELQMNLASKSRPRLGSRTSSISSLQGYNQLSLQSFRCSLILINIITYGHTYIIVALFSPVTTHNYLPNYRWCVLFITFSTRLSLRCVEIMLVAGPGTLATCSNTSPSRWYSDIVQAFFLSARY